MKKPISVLLSILIVFSALNALSFGVSAAESDDAAGSKTDILFGDVNGDGTVDFDDVLGINAIIGDESVSEETKIIADVNDDGAVTYADAVELKTALDNGDIYSLTIYDRLSDAGFCGKNGSNVKYIIKKDGKAIIFGSGAIKDSRISQIWLYSAEELIIKNGVTVIGANAFYNCSSVVSVEFPESLTEIKKEAFCRCGELNSITIPKGVTSIGLDAFSSCDSLASITVEDGNTVYDSREGCNAIIETATNTLILGCKTTIMLDSLNGIGEKAFYNCWNLSRIYIPKGSCIRQQRGLRRYHRNGDRHPDQRLQKYGDTGRYNKYR